MIRENDKYGRVFDVSVELKDNAMLRKRSELFEQWDFKKNDELGLDIYLVTFGSKRSVWWNCPKCGSIYDMPIVQRINGCDCPFCAGKRANHTNSLASLKPNLSLEWHLAKNGELTPNDVTCGCDKKVWWIGECGHEWEAKIDSRSRGGHGCPYCSNVKVLIGFNDIWTTNPPLAKLLANPENGFKYSQSSNKRVDWECSDCNEIIRNRVIGSIQKEGLSCPNCSDGIKYPEKVMYNVLTQLGVDFEFQKEFKWSNKKRYDFYLPIYDLIIETHGSQHYGFGFEGFGEVSLENQTEIDSYKSELASNNKISNYVVIDCRKSVFSFIQASIISSSLNGIFDLSEINWDDVNLNSQKSTYVNFLNLWNEGLSVKEIARATKFNYQTISKVLRNYNDIGKCVYDPNRGVLKYIEERNSIAIYQFNKDFELVRKWSGFNEILSETNYFRCAIQNCFLGRSKTSYGFIWRLEKDVIDSFTLLPIH